MATLWRSGSRLLTFVAPAVWLSGRAGFELHHLRYVSVTSVALQAALSYWLLRGEFRRQHETQARA